MAGIDLIFSRAPRGGSPVDLVFGADTAPDVVAVEVSLTATLPAMTFVANASYISNTQRPLVGRTSSAWQVATHGESGATNRMQATLRLGVPSAPAWATADRTGAQIALPLLKEFVRVRNQVRELFRDADKLVPQIVFGGWGNLLHDTRPSLESRSANADARRAGRASTWQNMLHDRRTSRHSNWQDARAFAAGRTSQWQPADPFAAGWLAKHREAIRPPAGTSPGRPTAPVDPDRCYHPPLGSAVDLLFAIVWAHDADLVFVCAEDALPAAGIVVPIRRVYMVSNNVSLTRVDTGAVIRAFAAALDCDVDSWTWGFSASVHGTSLADVQPNEAGDPVELVLSLNGVAYRVIAEQISRERSFGRNELRVQGRGRAALLEAPYAPVKAFGGLPELTAQQLMAAVLTDNGVSIGWAVEFGLDDWLVPAGVFSAQGTYIAALDAIAKAAGGYLQPHRTEQTLRVLPRYPQVPWDWATVLPDFELPSAVMAQESIQWVDKPLYNRVYVSGTAGGVLGRVTRAGTDGGRPAPMVTDALITAAVAARQRGSSILSDVGRQARVSLKLPVLAETGVIVPGKFVRYVDGAATRLGLVRSVAVDASLPAVWQTIGVETHV